MGEILHRPDPVPGVLRSSHRVHSPGRPEHEGTAPYSRDIVLEICYCINRTRLVPDSQVCSYFDLQAIYLLANPGGTIKLYVFVAIFGVFMVILAQLPSFHSLRHVNLISLLLCLAYSFCAVAGSVYLGTTLTIQSQHFRDQRKIPVTSNGYDNAT